MKRIYISLSLLAVLCALAVTSERANSAPMLSGNGKSYIGVAADTADVQGSRAGTTYYATDDMAWYISNGTSWVVKAGELGNTVVNVTGAVLFAESLATNYGIEELGTAWLDSSFVVNASISGADIRVDAIDSTTVRAASIAGTDLRADAVDSTKVRDATISGADLRADAADSTKIRAASVAGSDLVNPLRIPTNTVYALNVDLGDSLRAKSAAFTSYFIANGAAILRGGLTTTGSATADTTKGTNAVFTGYSITDGASIVRGGQTVTGIAASDTVHTVNSVATGYSVTNGASIVRGGETVTGIAASDTVHTTNFAATGYGIVDGNSIIRGNQDISGLLSFKLPHLFVGFEDSSYTRDADQNIWYSVSNDGGNLFAVVDTVLCTYIPGDTLQVDVDGDYVLQANVSFSGNNGETFKFQFLHPDTTRIGYSSQRYTSNNDTGNVTIQAYHEFTAGEKVFLGVKNITDNDNPIFKAGTVFIRKAH